LPRTRRRPGAVMPCGPGGASIECSSAWHLPAAAFSTARRACDVASDILCRDPSGPVQPFGRASPWHRQAPPPPPSRQRRLLPRPQDAFPRRAPPCNAGDARRLLQPEQSTSTTTGSTDPRSELVHAARPACAGLGGEPLDGVEAIRHADHRIRVMTPALRPSLAARRRRAEPRLRPPPVRSMRATSRGLTGQGPAGFRRPAPPVWRRARTRRG